MHVGAPERRRGHHVDAVSSVDWFERHVRDLARRLSDDDGLRRRERIRSATVPAPLDRPPHHHHVHEHGWQLRLHPDRTLTLHHPDGTLAFTGTTVDVAPTGTADLDLITLADQRLDRLIAEQEAAAA